MTGTYNYARNQTPMVWQGAWVAALRQSGATLPRIDVLLRVELPCGCVASYLDRPADSFIRTDVGILPRDDEGGHDCKHGGVFVQYLPGVPLP